MTITDRTATKRVPMNSLRKTALVAGVFYLLTFVSIPTLALYGSVRGPNFIVGPGPDTPVILGAFLEMIVALAGIGTAVTLYPVVKRQGEARALGFVGSRTLEAATIYARHRQPPVDRDLAAGRRRSRCVGHRPGAGRPVLLDVLLRTELHSGRERRVAGLPVVPVAPGAAVLPVLGFIGAALLLASWFATLFGLLGPGTVSRLAALAALPIAAVGVLAGRLPGRLGLQAVPHHG